MLKDYLFIENLAKNIANSKQQASSMCIQFCDRFWINSSSIFAFKINKNQLQIETDKQYKNRCEGICKKTKGILRFQGPTLSNKVQQGPTRSNKGGGQGEVRPGSSCCVRRGEHAKGACPPEEVGQGRGRIQEAVCGEPIVYLCMCFRQRPKLCQFYCTCANDRNCVSQFYCTHS